MTRQNGPICSHMVDNETGVRQTVKAVERETARDRPRVAVGVPGDQLRLLPPRFTKPFA